jgi:hypothetical protein
VISLSSVAQGGGSVYGPQVMVVTSRGSEQQEVLVWCFSEEDGEKEK